MANEAAGLSVWEWDIKDRHHAHRREQPVPRTARRRRASSRAPTTPTSTCIPDDREGWVGAFHARCCTGTRPAVLATATARCSSTAPSATSSVHARVLRNAKGHADQRARHRLGRRPTKSWRSRRSRARRATCAKRRSASSAPCRARRTRCSSSTCARARSWHSPRFREMLGYDGHATATRTASSRRSSIPTTARSSARRWATTCTFGLPYDVEYRLRKNDGEWLWVRSRASAERDAEDRPLWLAGSIRDITDERAGREAMVLRHAGSGRGEPRQEHVPRDHESRDPHADERHHRHDRPAARHRPRSRAARLRRDDPRQRRLAADDPQRHPRLLQDRGRQARHREPRPRPARERR